MVRNYCPNLESHVSLTLSVHVGARPTNPVVFIFTVDQDPQDCHCSIPRQKFGSIHTVMFQVRVL